MSSLKALPLEMEISPDLVAYKPAVDAFFGMALELNVLGVAEKVCSFDCPYCSLGRSNVRLNQLKGDDFLPSPERILEAITLAFQRIHAHGPTIDTICISGNGEPTLHPNFDEIIRGVLSARDLWLPGKTVVARTNGASLDSRKVYDALNLLDQRIVKLDAASDKVFKAVNAPLSRTNVAKVLSGIRKLKDVTIQSMFVKGSVDNTQHSDIDDWIEVIALIRPKAVHIQGLKLPPAVKGVIACDEDTLYAIASRLERRTQIKAIVGG